MRRARWFVLFIVVFALAIPSLQAQAAATPEMAIVMFNLNNPRGLNFGPDGALYVAEAGRGGSQKCFGGPEGQVTAGLTGSISRLSRRGKQERIVTGMPSHADPDGFGALGPHDVLPLNGGRLTVTIGLGTDPANRSQCLPIGKDFGWLARAQSNNHWRPVVDLAAFEARANPDNSNAPDSDPYGLLVPTRGRDADRNQNESDDQGNDENDDANGGGPQTIATDAGGNTLLAIGPGKRVSTLAVFPSRSSGRFTDSVPTTVVRGMDGMLYVGELTGFPFKSGEANIYRVVPGSTTPAVYLSGFTAVVDMAFGRDGSLYVLQFATGDGLAGPGALIRVAPNGSRSTVWSGLVAPTSVAIGPDGAFYISNCGVFPADPIPPCVAGGGGHVLRVKV